MGSRNADSGSDGGGQTPSSSDSGGFDGQPIGGYLKLQREIRGISAEELALQTRIPLRSLERLESGSFDGETDGFVRGFVRTVADALGLDPDDTISRMLAEPKVEEASRIDLPVTLTRTFVGVVFVVLMAAAVGLVKAVVVSEEAASTGQPHAVHAYRRDPVRALAETQVAVERDRQASPALSAALQTRERDARP